MSFSQASGKRGEEIDLPDGSTLGEMIALVKEKNGGDFSKLLEDSMENGTLAFLVNKSVVEDDQTNLKEGDEVIISHIVGGG
jgi:molybdopterin converting factor small subunit